MKTQHQDVLKKSQKQTNESRTKLLFLMNDEKWQRFFKYVFLKYFLRNFFFFNKFKFELKLKSEYGNVNVVRSYVKLMLNVT